MESYERLLREADARFGGGEGTEVCGQPGCGCCRIPMICCSLRACISSQVMNRSLKHEQRQRVIDAAHVLAQRLRDLHHDQPEGCTYEQLAANSGVDLRLSAAGRLRLPGLC